MTSRNKPPSGGNTTLSRLVESAVALLRKKLLDLTLRNRLLNFKFTETSRKFVRIIDEVPDNLFVSLTDESPVPKKLFFQALPEPEEQDPTETTGKFKAALEEARFTDLQYHSALTAGNAEQQPQLFQDPEVALRARVGAALGIKATRGKSKVDLAAWAHENGIDPSFDLPVTSPRKPEHSDKFIQTLLLPDALERKTSGLREDARLAQQELGLSTLYAAFGYLEWFESPDSQEPLFAPLVLLPVEIDRELKHHRYSYFIQSGAGQDAVINLTLKERLLQDFNIVIPEFDEEDTPETYFHKVQLAVNGQKRWKIRRFIVIGHFSFSRLVMYEDLDSARWVSTPPHEQALVRDILAGSDSAGPNTYADDYDVDDPHVERLVPFLVTDADSSQFSALADAMSGRSFALQGPPGTGKSQTITNFIATALATDKTVLFVAEKMAALEVVAKRLRDAGLGSFLLELHSTKIQKKRLLDSFSERLKIGSSASNRLDQKYQDTLARLRQIRDEIRRYVDLLNQEIGNSGITLHGAYWQEQRARDALTAECRAELEELTLPEAHEFTAATIGERVALMRQYANQLERTFPTGGIQDHHFYGIDSPGHSSFDISKVDSALRELLSAIKQIIAVLTRFGAGFRIQLPGDLTTCRELVGELQGIPDSSNEVDFAVLQHLRDSHSLTELEAAEQALSEISQFAEALAGAFEDPHTALASHSEIQQNAALLEPLVGIAISVNDRTIDARTLLDAEHERVTKGLRVLKQLEQFATLAEVGRHSSAVETAKALLEAAQLVRSAESDSLNFRHAGLLRASAVASLDALSKQAGEIRSRFQELSSRFELSALPSTDVLREAADVCAATNFISYWCGRPGARVRKTYRLVTRGKSASKREVESDLRAIVAALAHKAEFERELGLKALSGSWNTGIDTPFDRLKSAASFIQMVVQRFSVLDAFRGTVQRALISADAGLLRALTVIDSDDLRSTGELLARPWQVAESMSESLIAHLSIAAAARTALRVLCDHTAIPDAPIGTVLSVARRLSAISDVRRELIGLHWLGLQKLVINAASKDLARLSATSAYFTVVKRAEIPSQMRETFLADNGRSKLALAKQFASLVEASIQSLERIRERFRTEFSVDYAKAFRSQFAGGGELLVLREVIAQAINLGADAKVDWINYRHVAKRVDSLGVGPVAYVVERHQLSADGAEPAYLYVHLRSLIGHIVSKHPELARWTGLRLESLRQELVRLDREYMDVSRRSVYDNVRRKPVPIGRSQGPAAAITERSLIEREAAKQRRHMPIRSLLQRAGAAAKALKPCFMMSPASVSQFLSPDAGQFDVVVIDEASQMRPEEALCAISRAKQAVIVGDPMQLPPTSFFDSVQESAASDSEEELDIDTESILDRAISALRPVRDLKWHYRSKHHSLIAFSNREFYQDRLIVFPSPTRHGPKLGVTLVPVTAGAYKASINPLEADTVVETVCSLARMHPDRSIGVVSINQPQKELLVERFDRAFADSVELDSYRQKWDGTLEPFFVKNLENVQGDERDIIVISTVYGPEQPGGPVHQRFGPINTNVGHRRLNVLFTRAKERVVLVSTLKAEDIVISASSKLGVKALKGYLEYARSGRLEQGHAGPDVFESPFEYQVARLLRAKGFDVASQVGVAGYRIDLAVRSRANHDHFILGIECDGATYHSAKCARDRDRLRQEVLERLGWRLYRIWSTDWFNNREREASRLQHEVEQLQSQYDVSIHASSHAAEVVKEQPSNSTSGYETIGVEPKLTLEEARHALINLRTRIWEELGAGPSADGILRKSMIDAFLAHLPRSKAEVETMMGENWASVEPTQRQFLPRILSILGRVKHDGNAI